METLGDKDTSGLLATIMGGDLDADAARAHVHGFHAYPARMHPTLARRGIELLCPKSGRVLDPFCGSGTVLVEAKLAARSSHGIDINPLSVLLSHLKTFPASDQNLSSLVASATHVALHAETRRKERRGATRRYPAEDVQLFDPHVLLELDGLLEGLQSVREGYARDALRLVLSAILVKVSRQSGDTSNRPSVPKRLASGYAVSLFEKKSQELARRVDAYRRLLPAPFAPTTLTEGDARTLSSVEDQSVDLVLSSPPYAGNYDYLDHHRTRLRWLGLSFERMADSEIGARRHLASMDYGEAVRRFNDQMSEVLGMLKRKLRNQGRVALLIADSVVAGKAVWADPLIRRCADRAGLQWVATASQVRPHFHAGSKGAFAREPRREHLIVLRK